MKVMLENLRAAHKAAFRSLAKMTFDIASKKDFSNQVLAKILQASLASLMLGGAFESRQQIYSIMIKYCRPISIAASHG